MNTAHTHDPWPEWIEGFLAGQAAPSVQLLEGMREHVFYVARRYPDCCFALRRRDEDSMNDLLAAVFERCATKPLSRYPFCAEVPFRRYAAGLPESLRRSWDEGQFPGRRIKGLTFHWRPWSITRNELRLQAERNLRRSPRERWLVWLDLTIGEALRAVAVERSSPGERAALWALPGGPRVTREPSTGVVALLRAQKRALTTHKDRAVVRELVPQALDLLGVASQAQLTGLLTEVLGGPGEEAELTPPDAAQLLAVQEAMAVVWERLDETQRGLLRLVSEGATLRELVEAHKELGCERRLSEQLKQCAEHVLDVLYAELELPPRDNRAGKRALEEVGAVMAWCLPGFTGGEA